MVASLAVGFAPASSQASSASGSGVASVSVAHYYTLNALGFGVINDSFTFANNGTSSVQIPTLKVGLPSRISARTTGLVLGAGEPFSLSQSQQGANTTVTISPNQATLGPGANTTVILEGAVTNILNYSSNGFSSSAPTLVLYSPSLNVNVTRIKSNLLVPTGGGLQSLASGFAYSPANGTYTRTETGVFPQASEGYATFNYTSSGSFTPIEVTQLVRTIVPSANSSPMVVDKFTIRNMASYNMTEIRLNLLNHGVSSVTELPSTEPPLINPQRLSLSSGNLIIAQANVGSLLYPLSNLTVTFTYPLPASMMSISGNTVKLTIPYTPLVPAPVSNYSLILAPASGIVASGQSSILGKAVDPFTPGSAVFTYTVGLGWAADKAIPAGILVFAVAFALFAIQRPEGKAQETEKTSRRTSDVLRAFEEKTGLETQYMAEFASAGKGSIGKADFDRMRNEVSELRSRAIQRLNEMKQALGPGRQYDALTRVADGEKEEDRAFRDLLNLYVQYHGNRMNEETFRRLQPNYKKRVDSAINRLSDLLHAAQREER